jgi:hypothetical protein
MPVQIHGNQYMTVVERLAEAREHLKSINTEVIPNGGAVVVKATVVTDKGTFTGISAANPAKTIEKQSPYEVAETSAVGRALGFAGFGVVDSIASADEMTKATDIDPNVAFLNEMDQVSHEPKKAICATCGEAATLRSGVSSKTNKPYTGLFCSSEDKTHTKWMS